VGRANAVFTTDADLTITLADSNATQVARHYILNLTSSGSLTATRNLIVPSIDKPYIIENNTTGAQSIVVKTSAGTGVTVPNGKKVMVYADSTNVVQAFDYVPSLEIGVINGFDGDKGDITVSSIGTGAVTETKIGTGAVTETKIGTSAVTGTKIASAAVELTTKVTGTLPVANGGTGATTLTANSVLLGNGTSAPLTVAPGTSGNLLTSNGTTWTSAAPPSGGQYLGNATVKAIAYNAQTIGENITIGATQNGLSAGPITVDTGFEVTVATGGNWIIL